MRAIIASGDHRAKMNAISPKNPIDDEARACEEGATLPVWLAADAELDVDDEVIPDAAPGFPFLSDWVLFLVHSISKFLVPFSSSLHNR